MSAEATGGAGAAPEHEGGVLFSASAKHLWVFGYGSLMWRPGFPYLEAVHARLIGYRRCFCIYSIHHRGTPSRPGMVLGLDRGGSCEGVAFRVAPDLADATLGYLREREQVTGVYREAHLPVTLMKPARPEVMAVAYLVERAHPSYAGALPLATQARLIRGARGSSGVNLDYVVNTVNHLAQLGIRERELERLVTVIGPLVAKGRGENSEAPRALALMRAATTAGCAVDVPVQRMRLNERMRFAYRRRHP
jgi:cation transport protein ChaC